MEAMVERAMAEVAEADEDRRPQLMAESNRALGEYFMRHPQEMEEVAFQLFEIPWSDTMNGAEAIVNKVIDVKTVDLGATDFVDEDLRGLSAQWQGVGGQILSGILRYERTQMPREQMATAIDLHRNEILLDFWGTFSKLQTQANEKISQLPVQRLIQLIQSGIQGGTTFGTFPASTLTSNNIDPILDFVSQRSKGNISIMGSRNALRILSSLGVQYGPNVAEKIFTAGQVGVYKGYPLVLIENFEDFAGNLVMPNNELWIVGQNAGRMTYFGSQPAVQQLARAGFYVRWETAKEVGMLLYGIGRGRLGRIVFT